MIGIFQAVIAIFVAQRKASSFDQEGKIDKVIEPGRVWRVAHKATFWFARSHADANFRPGDWVKVVGREGIVLLIEPMEDDEK
jgi:membrane protein implicated in regulation of membrane protease activity